MMLHVSTHDKAKVTLQGKVYKQMTAAQMTAFSCSGLTHSAKVDLADGHASQEAALCMGMHFSVLLKKGCWSYP